MSDLYDDICRFIQDKLGIEPSALFPGASFRDDLEVDSLDFCELIFDIEKKYNITIPDDQVERLKTVETLVNFVTKQVGQKMPHVAPLKARVPASQSTAAVHTA